MGHVQIDATCLFERDLRSWCSWCPFRINKRLDVNENIFLANVLPNLEMLRDSNCSAKPLSLTKGDVSYDFFCIAKSLMFASVWRRNRYSLGGCLNIPTSANNEDFINITWRAAIVRQEIMVRSYFLESHRKYLKSHVIMENDIFIFIFQAAWKTQWEIPARLIPQGVTAPSPSRVHSRFQSRPWNSLVSLLGLLANSQISLSVSCL